MPCKVSFIRVDAHDAYENETFMKAFKWKVKNADKILVRLTL